MTEQTKTATALPSANLSLKHVGFALASLVLAAAASHQMLNSAQADGFGDETPTSFEEVRADTERCILAPETARHPGTGASILVLRPTC
ncbi:MAG: hypothetical protein AAGH43_12565 [Pseudomonadota bacterium]